MLRRRALQGLLLPLLAGGTAQAAPPEMSRRLSVGGQVAIPAEYTPADLAAKFSVHERMFAPHGEGGRRYAGVLLRDLIAAARPLEPDRLALRQSYVAVRATDGYVALYSWAELFLSPIGDDALIAFRRDGEPLGESEGLIAAFSARDTRAAPRYVKWATAIELRRAPP